MNALFTRTNILLAMLAVFLVAFIVTATPVEAQLFSECEGGAAANSELCQVVNNPDDDIITGSDSLVVRIVDLLIFISGAIAVIMVAIGGLRYILSNGDPQGTQSAKNTILYAIVGIIIAVAARTIIIFVLDRIS